MRLEIKQIKSDINKNWDNIDYDNDLETITIIEGTDNTDCERQLANLPFDEDTMCAIYTD